MQLIMMEIKNDHFFLRPFTEEDLDFLYSLYSDQLVMKKIPPRGEIRSLEQTKNSLQNFLIHWQQHQFGMFVVHSKIDSCPIGYIGLRILPPRKETELGDIFSKKSWGKGVASECIKLVIDWASSLNKFSELVAVTHPENTPSHKVLKKNRFVRDPNRDGIYHQMHHIFFTKQISEQ